MTGIIRGSQSGVNKVYTYNVTLYKREKIKLNNQPGFQPVHWTKGDFKRTGWFLCYLVIQITVTRVVCKLLLLVQHF